MNNDLTKELYDSVIKSRNVNLTDLQRIKFLNACEKTIEENPTLNLQGLKIAANIYLNFVLDFQDLDLGPTVLHSE